MVRRHFSSLMFVVLLASVVLALTGCHSSRKAVSAVPSKADVEQMRKDAMGHKTEPGAISRILAEASSWIGTPYSYAGHSRKGTDCSGLVMEVFGKIFNVKTPRSSREQQQWCKKLKRRDLRPGDLVFFATGSDPSRVSHVGIYIGDGDMIHASSSRGVIMSSLDEKYYTKCFHSAGRPYPVEKAYASRSSRKRDKKAKDEEILQESPALPSSPAVPAATTVLTLDELLGGVSPSPADARQQVAPPKVDLDSVISQEIDSIFSSPSFFD